MNRINSHSLLSQGPKLSTQLANIHSTIIKNCPSIDRVACALYDPKTDLLKTFIDSTHQGQSIVAYECKLRDSASLSQIASSGMCRVVDDIPNTFKQASEHTNWLMGERYKSSFTIPMLHEGVFLGFIFFDSFHAQCFNVKLQRDLLLHSNLIIMSILSEYFAVNSLISTVSVARDFSDFRDFETGLHLDRMAQLSRLIAKAVAAHYQLTDEFIEHVYLFAPLHDIGKIGIPDNILLKAGKLTPEERVIMQSHVDKGLVILNKILNDYEIGHLADSEIMMNIVACHHEFLNGSGYPNQLVGEQIPIEARIVTVADIFDALSSHRPYKKRWSIKESMAELEYMVEKGLLDPICVDALKKHRKEATDIVNKLS